MVGTLRCVDDRCLVVIDFDNYLRCLVAFAAAAETAAQLLCSLICPFWLYSNHDICYCYYYYVAAAGAVVVYVAPDAISLLKQSLASHLLVHCGALQSTSPVAVHEEERMTNLT